MIVSRYVGREGVPIRGVLCTPDSAIYTFDRVCVSNSAPQKNNGSARLGEVANHARGLELVEQRHKAVLTCFVDTKRLGSIYRTPSHFVSLRQDFKLTITILPWCRWLRADDRLPGSRIFATSDWRQEGASGGRACSSVVLSRFPVVTTHSLNGILGSKCTRKYPANE